MQLLIWIQHHVWPTCSAAAFVGTDITKKYTVFETTVRQNRKTVAARDVCSVFGLLLMRVICCGVETDTGCCSHCVRSIREHGGGAKV